MLDPALVQLAWQFLAEGLSQRAVARRLGISRGTVWRMATGRRREPGADRKAELLLSGCTTRCPGCGRKMRIPIGSEKCLACLRSGGADVRPPVAESVDPPKLDLELRGQAAQRIERERRQALLRQDIDPAAADQVDEDAVAEKQRRVEMGDAGGHDTQWRRIEEELNDVDHAEERPPTPDDVAEPEN